MASMTDFLRREIQLQRKMIQGERTQNQVGREQALEEFEIEFQCIKKILEAENPLNEHYYLAVEKKGWNDFVMVLKVQQRLIKVIVEESVYRGQVNKKEKIIDTGEMQFLGGTRVVWIPDNRQWGYQYEKENGEEGFHVVGNTEMLLNLFLDYATKKIAKSLEKA